MDEKNSEDFINQRFEEQYRSAGFDEESIRMAIRDLKDGMDKDIVDCYMMLSLSPKHRSEMANLFRQGMPLDIGRRLRLMNEDQLNEVFTYASERIPFVAIREVIMHNSSPHQIKKAFELYKEYTKDFAGKVTIKKPTTNVDDEKEDENAAKQTDSTDVVEQTEVEDKTSIPDSKELVKEIHQVFADSTNTLIENINEKNAGIYADMISRFDDGIQAIVDEIRKDMRANYSLQTPKDSDVTVVDKPGDTPVPTPTPQVSSEPATIRQQAASVLPTPPLGSESAIQSDMPSPTPVSSRAPEERVIRRPRPSYLEDAVSYTRMILMPDGSLRPIEVERENPKKPKGLLGLASRIFGKDTPQESLLRQLINGRLTGPQLKQILRAVKAAFSPLEIKDLIESDLEPEEMGSIIDVILADRGQILEVV